MSIVAYFTLLATLGSTTHGQRTIAYYREDKDKLSKEFWNIISFRLIATIIAVFLYLVFLYFTNGVTTLGLLVIMNIVNVAIDVTWFYQGVEDFRQIAIRGILVKVFGLIGIFIFVKSVNDTWKYAIILLGSTILGNLALWINIPKLVDKPHSIKPFSDIKDMWLVFLPTIASQVYIVLDKSMIGWISKSNYANGCYEQSEKLIRVAILLVTSISSVILPRVANLYHINKMKEVRRYVYSAYRVIFLLAMPLLFGVIGGASIFIPIYLGSGYDMSIQLLQIFSGLLIVVSLASVTGLAYLVPTRQQNVYTISVTMAAVVNLTLNSFFISRYSAIGAAVASVTAETIGTIIQIGYCIYSKQLDLRKIFFPSWRYYVASIIMFICLLLEKKYVTLNIVGLLVLVITGIAVYGAIILLLKDDFAIEQIEKVLRKLKT